MRSRSCMMSTSEWLLALFGVSPRGVSTLLVLIWEDFERLAGLAVILEGYTTYEREWKPVQYPAFAVQGGWIDQSSDCHPTASKLDRDIRYVCRVPQTTTTSFLVTLSLQDGLTTYSVLFLP